MIKEVTAAQGELTGNIVISIGETLLIYRFPPIIEEFKNCILMSISSGTN